MNCKFWRRADGKLETILTENMTGTKFTETCVFKIVDFFIEAVKTNRIVAREFLVYEIESEMSYFEDEDVEDES